MRALDRNQKQPRYRARLARLLTLLLLPCWPLAMVAAQPSTEVRLQLKWHHQFQFAGFYAAQAKGFYQQEGLAVRMIECDARRSPAEEVLNGRAEFGVSDAVLLKTWTDGKPIVALAVIFQHSPYILITRADRGLRKPSDLQGKKIMISDELGLTQLKTMFRREGMPADAAQLVPNTNWSSDLLINGQVDAISAYLSVEPFQLRALGVEPAMIRASDYGMDFYGDTLFTTLAELKQHPGRVAAFRRASLRGWHYAMAHPAEIIDLILTLPGVRQRGVTREMLTYEADAMRELILPDLVEIGHMNPGRWEAIGRTYAEAGVIPRAPSEEELQSFLYRPGGNGMEVARWLKPLLVAVAIIGFAAAWILMWNLQLRRAVARRTAALHEAEQQIRFHVENSPLAVIEFDREFRVKHWTGQAEQVFGWTEVELLGKHPNDWRFIYDGDAARLDELIKRLAAGEVQRNITTNRNYRKDGTVVDCEWYNTACRDKSGKVTSILCLALDVTAKKRAEEQAARTNADLEHLVDERTAALRAAMADMEQMSYSMVHDLRAPLRAISGFGGILEVEEPGLSKEGRANLARMRGAAERLDQLICDVLNYSKVIRGEMPLKPVEVSPLIRSLVETCPEFQPPKARVVIAPDIPCVLANEAALAQCFSNLLNNAAKFGANGKPAEIYISSAPAEEGRVRVLVEDRGPGIAPEYHDRIFGIFQRLDADQPGTGMGLAIVKKAVERMGGRVGVDSQLGKGSRFWIELPAAFPAKGV